MYLYISVYSTQESVMKISSGTILFISVIYCTLLSLSLYGGFSEKANVFCMGPFLFESTGIGPSGKVVIWLRIFAIFLIVCLSLFSVLLIFANMTFKQEAYDEIKKEMFDAENQKIYDADNQQLLQNHVGFLKLPSYKSETTGFLAIDALKVYELYTHNILDLYTLSVVFCWFSWIVWGILVLSLYVPIECSRHRIGDNTSFVMMYIVVVIAWSPFVLMFRS